MARPIKQGLDYFPHDTNASSDEKIEPLIILYGAKGYAFYFMHLEYIYRNSDFVLNVSDADIQQIFCRKLAITEQEYGTILATTLKHGCFDRAYYEKTGCITSNGVYKRASVIVAKRERMKALYEANKMVSDTETTQKPMQKPDKGKERKGKYIKDKGSIKNKVIPKVNNNTLKEVVGKFHEICPSLPKIEKITDLRKVKLELRLKELGSLDKLYDVFKKAEDSDFLTGRKERNEGHENWICTFDFIIGSETTMMKIIEGAYDNKSHQSHPKSSYLGTAGSDQETLDKFKQLDDKREKEWKKD